MDCRASTDVTCEGKSDVNDLSAIMPVAGNGGDVPSLAAGSSSGADANGYVTASVSMQTAAAAAGSQSKSLFFSQEASSIFDKALEMHAAPTDDPPMWGDDLEDLGDFTDMLEDIEELSTSNIVVGLNDFFSAPNLKTASKKETLECLIDRADSYAYNSLDAKNHGEGSKGSNNLSSGVSSSNTAVSGANAELPMNMDKRIFEDNMFMGDIVQAECDHMDYISGPGFGERVIFDDDCPDMLLNLKPEYADTVSESMAPMEQAYFDLPPPKSNHLPSTTMSPVVTPTPRKSSSSRNIEVKEVNAPMSTMTLLPKVSVEGSPKKYINSMPSTLSKQMVDSTSSSCNDVKVAANVENQIHMCHQDRYLGASKSCAAWKRRFAELEDFNRQNGNCNVPQKYPPNPSLGAWVARQRLLMRQWEDWHENSKPCKDDGGKLTIMSSERVQCLKSIGLESSIGKGTLGKLCSRNINEWEKQFADLLRYRDANRTCDVPTKCTSLGRWVSNQRKKYRDFHADEGRNQDQAFGW
eukprot:CAMPEP_0181110142 /NCGR_PEP_ID=MMETSP1071-20121207/18557_1 /TAXON_ID=35127 /ORGANISM="Thalassiosira sp., Strain NH16" /LENGTH=523 /DNA_ID=CAMNT_0023193895 /DNA_START=437 /DNA_END=2005 /DNA_ORIENTATION=-